MILDYIRGLLIASSPHQATLELQGLGFRIFIHSSTFEKLPSIGKDLLLYIATIIREDSHRLYGFLTYQERNFFETLNEISGIGPKLALSLLACMTLDDLHLAIQQGNAKVLSTIPGVGKKTAERLIIELRDKIKEMFSSVHSGLAVDAVSALINLGYNPLEAQAAVKVSLENKEKDLSLSQLIALALKQPPRRK